MPNNISRAELVPAATSYLEEQDFQIIETNWSTRYARLDIIARFHKTLHIIEIKHIWSEGPMDTTELLSHSKQTRLHSYARIWADIHHETKGYQLDLLIIAGPLDNFLFSFHESIKST
jgi:Holliday junction resolvase-like predicted endonuclease